MHFGIVGGFIMAKKLEFESAVKRLEDIVRSLEGGELSLKEALEAFEEGIKLINFSNQELESAEKKIEILLDANNGKKKRANFDPHNIKPE